MVWGVSGRGLSMPRDASLSDSYTSDRCCFTSPEMNYRHIHGTYLRKEILHQKQPRTLILSLAKLHQISDCNLHFTMIYLCTKWNFILCQINRESVITIQIWFNLKRLRIESFVCSKIHHTLKGTNLRFPLNWTEYDRAGNSLLIVNQMEFRLIYNQERIINTIVCHSIWKEIKIHF